MHPAPNTEFLVGCSVSKYPIATLHAKIADSVGVERSCSLVSWSGSTASFSCNAGACTDGSQKPVTCYIDSSESCKAGLDFSQGIVPNCETNIHGYVKDSNNQPVSSATIEAVGNDNTYTATTDATGYYRLPLLGNLNYDLIASQYSYQPDFRSQFVPAYGDIALNFSITYVDTPCEMDCTYKADTACHADCDGNIVGCGFFNEASKTACDSQQKGWIVEYNTTHNVICCNGVPFAKTSAKMVEDGSTQNKVRQVRIVMYRGKPVKMIVDVYG